ncbi:hypothetical protein H6504_00445 [Candidatus Woesearchaeota archaeon]|nr:hypothetical protein [Candidatus Woesearchaeota archaeon]
MGTQRKRHVYNHKWTTEDIRKCLELRKKGLSIRKIAVNTGLAVSSVSKKLIQYRMRQDMSGSNETAVKFGIHNMQINVPIIEKPRQWNPSAILQKKKIRFSKLNRTNWDEFVIKRYSCSIHITTESILIYPNHTFSSMSAEDAKTLADQIAMDAIPKIENLFLIKLSNNYGAVFTITKQHTVLFNEKLFNYLDSIGFKRIRDENGYIRLGLDRSKGNKHIESEHPRFSDRDISRVDRLVKEVVTDNISLSVMRNAIGNIQQAVLNQNDRLFKLEQRCLTEPEDLDLGGVPDYVG